MFITRLNPKSFDPYCPTNVSHWDPMNKSWSDRRFCPCKQCKFVSWDGGPILWAKGPTWTRNRQKSGPILRVGPKLWSSQPRCLRLVVSYLKVTCLPILLFPIFIQWSTQYGQLFKKPKKAQTPYSTHRWVVFYKY